LILPYIEQNALWEQMDIRCDGSATAQNVLDQPIISLVKTEIPLYFFPTDSAQGRIAHAAGPGTDLGARSRSNYAYAISVDGFHNSWADCSFDSPLGRRPALYLNSTTRISQITDGTSKTIILSEMIAGLLDSTPDADGRGVWSDSFGCSFSGRVVAEQPLGRPVSVQLPGSASGRLAGRTLCATFLRLLGERGPQPPSGRGNGGLSGWFGSVPVGLCGCQYLASHAEHGCG